MSDVICFNHYSSIGSGHVITTTVKTVVNFFELWTLIYVTPIRLPSLLVWITMVVTMIESWSESLSIISFAEKMMLEDAPERYESGYTIPQHTVDTPCAGERRIISIEPVCG